MSSLTLAHVGVPEFVTELLQRVIRGRERKAPCSSAARRARHVRRRHAQGHTRGERATRHDEATCEYRTATLDQADWPTHMPMTAAHDHDAAVASVVVLQDVVPIRHEGALRR